MTQPVSPADQQLLTHLGALARTVDPPPALLTDLGRAALSLRRLDAELAELVADSDVALSGVRGATSTARLLTFEAGELVVEAQVSGPGGAHDVLGQVVPEPARGGASGSRQPAGTARPPSTRWAASASTVPSGLVRVTVELPARRPVTTAWVRV